MYQNYLLSALVLVLGAYVLVVLIEIADAAWEALALWYNDRKEDKENEKLDIVEQNCSEILEQIAPIIQTKAAGDR
jgi:hypothetical protein